MTFSAAAEDLGDTGPGVRRPFAKSSAAEEGGAGESDAGASSAESGAAGPDDEERRRGRDFALLWSGSAASQLGSMSSATAGPLLALAMTNSPVYAGWVAAASTIPSLLVHLPAGWLIDRFDRRKLMLVSQISRVPVAAALICGLLLIRSPTPMLIAAAFLDGTFSVLYSIAEITAVQRVVSPRVRPSALAKNETRPHIALLAGRPLGGLLFNLNRTLPYIADLATTVASIVTLLLMKQTDFKPRRDQLESAQRHRVGIGRGLKGVVRDPFLRTVIIVCTVGNFLFQTVVLLLVVQARQAGVSGAVIGLLLAASGLGGLAGAIVAPRSLKRIDNLSAFILACLWAWLPLTLLVAVFRQPVVGLIAWGCVSFMGSHLNLALANYQADIVPENMLGRVISINRLLTSGAVPLGALSAGYFIEFLDPTGAAWFVVIAIGGLACAAPMLLRPEIPLPARFKIWLRALFRRGRSSGQAWAARSWPREVLRLGPSIGVAITVFSAIATTWRRDR